MTTLIKLTLVDETNAGKCEWEATINAANILYFHRLPEAPSTRIIMGFGVIIPVKETPEQIAELIFNAEHPQCKL